MGGIPLPALSVRAPEQPDAMSTVAKLLQIKQALAQQAMLPGQMQLQKQQVEAGGQENQMRAQQIADQQAMTKAMQEWDGKDLNSLTPLVVKHGASATAVMGLKSKILEQQDKYSTIAKNDAETGAKNLETMKGKNDMVLGALNTVVQTPDEQFGQALTSTVQDLTQRGILDPQHAQVAAQLAQMEPAKAKQALALFEKSLMSNSQQMTQAKEQSDLDAKAAELPGQRAESQIKSSQAAFAQKYGLPAGVPVDMMEMTDYLDKNPGKGPKDYAAWKASIAPSVRFNLETQAGGGAGAPQTPGGTTDWAAVSKRLGMSPQALDQSAERYFQTGTLPPLGRGTSGPALQRAIMNRTAELHPEGELAANSAAFKANSESLKKLQTNFDQVSAFESTATKNIDLLQQTAQKIPDLGSRFANIPVRMINERMIGTDQMAAFKTALNTAQTESAKVLNSSSASGVLSDSARHELQDIVDGNMPYSAMVSSLNTLKQDMANRHQSYADQIAEIQKRLGGKTNAAPANKQQQPGGFNWQNFGGVQH